MELLMELLESHLDTAATTSRPTPHHRGLAAELQHPARGDPEAVAAPTW